MSLQSELYMTRQKKRVYCIIIAKNKNKNTVNMTFYCILFSSLVLGTEHMLTNSDTSQPELSAI